MLPSQSILDVFQRIISIKDGKSHPEYALQLCRLLASHEESNENKNPELMYALKKLIRGLGSSNETCRREFYSILCTVLNSFGKLDLLPNIKTIINNEMGTTASKREEGEVSAGKLFAYGAAIKMNTFSNCKDYTLREEILREMFEVAGKRSYLPLFLYNFIEFLICEMPSDEFRTRLEPVLKEYVIVPWDRQSVHTLHCLLKIENLHSLSRETADLLRTNHVLSKNTVDKVIAIMMKVNDYKELNAPLYRNLGRYLHKDADVFNHFWNRINVLFESKMTIVQRRGVFYIYQHMLDYVCKEWVPIMLTPNMLKYLMEQYEMNTEESVGDCYRGVISATVDKVTDVSNSEVNSTLLYDLIIRLLFKSGHFLFERMTGTKIVSRFTSMLSAEHLALLLKHCIHVIKMKKSSEYDYLNKNWTLAERIYAVSVYARLLTAKALEPERLSHGMQDFIKFGVFKNTGVDAGTDKYEKDVAAAIRNGFNTILKNVQPMKLDSYVKFLKPLVEKAYEFMTDEKYSLRINIKNKDIQFWRDTFLEVCTLHKHIETISDEKERRIFTVFESIYLQMLFYTFTEPSDAIESIRELNKCYVKIKDNKTSSENTDWIVELIELFLGLLTRENYLLRSLITNSFKELCPYLTDQATYAITEALKPDFSITPEDEDEDSSENEDDEDNEEGEDDSDIEYDDNDQLNLQLSARLKNAFNEFNITEKSEDEESIDLDEMPEDEGRRLDEIVNKIIKPVTPNDKKLSPEDQLRLNFRLRVLQIIEVVLSSRPPIPTVLDIIISLFQLLEWCITKFNQKHLEERIRSVFRKFKNLKYSCVERTEDEILAKVLDIVLGKENRTAYVFASMLDEITTCSMFIVRVNYELSAITGKLETQVYKDLIKKHANNFFYKRECTLPDSLFQRILTTRSPENISLCNEILKNTFDPVLRNYHKSQGLKCLNSFFHANHRIRHDVKNPKGFDKLVQKTLSCCKRILSNYQDYSPSLMKGVFELLLQIARTDSTPIDRWRGMHKILNDPESLPPPLAKNIKKLKSQLLAYLNGIQNNVGTADIVPSEDVPQDVAEDVLKRKSRKRKNINNDSVNDEPKVENSNYGNVPDVHLQGSSRMKLKEQSVHLMDKDEKETSVIKEIAGPQSNSKIVKYKKKYKHNVDPTDIVPSKDVSQKKSKKRKNIENVPEDIHSQSSSITRLEGQPVHLVDEDEKEISMITKEYDRPQSSSKIVKCRKKYKRGT